MSNIRDSIVYLKHQYGQEAKTEAIKDVCLDLLRAFKKVCLQYKLKWWVDGGTLLGTARDGKMIPWDDDVDVTMPRKDYNKLLNIAQRRPDIFGKRYFFQTANTDQYFEVHAKLRDNQSTALTEREYRGSHNKGMFLDIFPLDNVAPLLQTREDVAGFVKTIAKHSGQDTTPSNQVYYFNVFNNILTDLDDRYKNSEYIANVVFWRYDKKLVVLKKEWYAKTIMMPFEGMTVPVPFMMGQVLQAWYGESWKTPQHVDNCHKGYVDPFTAYKMYGKITKDEFEYLIKQFINCSKSSLK